MSRVQIPSGPYYHMKNLFEWIEELKDSKKLIIVEGKKDKKALEKLDIKNIKFVKGPLYKFIESIRQKEVILLLDLDKEGKKLYAKLKLGLQKRGIKINYKFRKFLFKTRLSQIEGINNYIKRY